MTDWIPDAAKIIAAIAGTLAVVWVAQINRTAALAETVRLQEESIRAYLKEQLQLQAGEVKALRKRVGVLEKANAGVRRLVGSALNRLALGQPVDKEFAAILQTLDDAEGGA